jgi:hypothetical protein
MTNYSNRYDYEIIYRKVKENVVADSLCKKYEDVGFLLVLSVPLLDWLEVTHQEWFNDPLTAQLICTLQATPHTTPG